MSSQDQQPASVFPTPPKFIDSFTTTNIEHLSRLCREARLDAEPDPLSDLSAALNVPSELKDLIPPSPPGPGQSWQVFGEVKLLPPPDLPYIDPSTKFLHPLPPSPESIVRLTRSALLAFLEITHVLALDPTPDKRYGTNWEDLRDLLLNANRAVNIFRPWAARQQLIHTLESYASDARAEISRVDELEARVDGLLTDMSSMGRDRKSTSLLTTSKRQELDNMDANEGAVKATSVRGGVDDDSGAIFESRTIPEQDVNNDRLAWTLVDD